MLNILSFLFGTICGVWIDRLWSKYEALPRLQLEFGYHHDRFGEGLSYDVTNVGLSPIPEYSICLYHPSRGRISGFLTEQTGELLPDQTRKHTCPLIMNGQPEQFFSMWLYRERGEAVESFDLGHFELRVVMENSDKILFKSTIIGNALAREMDRKIKNKGERFTMEEFKELCSPPPWGLRHWLKRRRERKLLEEHLREAYSRLPKEPL